ncbi:MAG: hypothetical protein AAF581_10405 [Planctomycetota bacterium]
MIDFDACEIATFLELNDKAPKLQLHDGRIVVGVLDAEELRHQHGRIYGFNHGDKVLVMPDDPPRVVFLITYAASQEDIGEDA